ncbi:ComEC/Rec2 family competence protein [Flavobacterium piscis]|uniref:Competence protein ComEC n=1 Tax=Flavobacterium piscis TaxID=1114874 RepID=A0ABU1Y429_9FLAO|nr:ComEC/Rec2 family competence protein [Flavobacterium piscis]MDR7208291.1 competence protein ComEC [Flavobacterium piscis]
MKVLQFPLTKITISFIIGILVSYCWQISIAVTIVAIAVQIIALIIFYHLSRKNKKINLFFGILTYFIFFFLGIMTLLFHTESLYKSNYIHSKSAFEETQLVTLIIREKLKSNDFNNRYIANINSIGKKLYSGKIILNVESDSTSNSLIVGNIIQTKTTLQHNSFPKNPNQFNYSNYLKDKQIYAQIYTTKADIRINEKIKKDIWYYAAKLHSRILHNLEKSHFAKTEMNVALALILGQRQEISSNIIQDYQFSGATHVLSVSGLHVGFIMLFISFILKPIPNTRKGSFIKLVAILNSLFIFAIISGLSPSVLRSVVMFSFLAIGNHLRRSGNTYHTLLVSILLILLFEPYFLFDIGFQLSYLALFFILWLQPLLKNIWSPKNKITSYIWDVLTVSFAAQIGTLPLCLYYFHQFPGLFFVTNIIIIPILSFIMIIGIIVMLVAIFKTPPLILIEIFEKSIYLLNKSIHFVASFESFIIHDISFNSYYLVTFYLLIISTIIWLKNPNYTKFIIVMISVIFLQFSFVITRKETESIHELIVYNLKKKTLISERNGRCITLFSNDNPIRKESNSTILNSYLVSNFGVVEKKRKIRNTLFFNFKKISIIDSTGIYQKRIQPDILLLIESPKINLERILKDLHPKIIVADASNSYSVQKLWKETCLKQKIPFHSTREKGFYKLNQ